MAMDMAPTGQTSSESDLVRDLHVPTRQRLCRKLNAPRLLGGDFKELAGLIGIPNDEIHFIVTRNDPAEEVMSWWEPKPSATVTQLQDYLTRMERPDLVEILDSRPSPCKLCFLYVSQVEIPFLSCINHSTKPFQPQDCLLGFYSGQCLDLRMGCSTHGYAPP